jgi:NAD(P)-dependent dehydrogenase (short-subunit alcohol dehydrogenase family)
VTGTRDLTGRTTIVTGATSGLGLASARALAARGARVVLTARDPGRGEAAAATVREAVPDADLVVEPLDLADLSSVRDFADRLTGATPRLDVLLNNAGVMMPPRRRTTADGFELQLGTNHLGHWVLTALLLPVLLATPGCRVVTVSSLAARNGRLSDADVRSEGPYRPGAAYATSKLANLVFALELDRRLREAGRDTLSVAAHPGVSATNLAATTGLPGPLVRLGGLLMQSAEHGALPQLHAATAPDVRGGDYYGPAGPGELRGRRVRRLTPPSAARDPEAATRLWAVSRDLTGVDVDPGRG